MTESSPISCAGYHAVQYQRQPDRGDGGQDQRLQHVQPDPPPHQICHEAHNVKKCQERHRLEVRSTLFSQKLSVHECGFRLVVMSLRAQSLLNLRLYKMKRHELKDYQRTIQDVLAKSGEEEVGKTLNIFLNLPFSPHQGEQQPAGQISPTPSPAGSEGSNCSKVGQSLNQISDYYFSSSVKRLHQQWGAATARSVDASHCTTYLPFNPQGLPIEIQIHNSPAFLQSTW